jgi:hypothetical protein
MQEIAILTPPTSVPIIIRILLKDKSKGNSKNYSVGLVTSDSQECNYLCDNLTSAGINYTALQLGNLHNKEGEMNYNVVILDYTNLDNVNQDMGLFITKMSKKNNNDLHAKCSDHKIIIVASKKKVLKQITTKYNLTCIDYYIDHNSSKKEYYSVINL